MQSDISVVKSLLLRGDQFPAVPKTANGYAANSGSSGGIGAKQNSEIDRSRSAKTLVSFNTEIPEWQRPVSVVETTPATIKAETATAVGDNVERDDNREIVA